VNESDKPRLREAERRQITLQAMDFDALVAPDDPVRGLWAMIEALDLSEFYAAIEARGSTPGAPATDPKILLALCDKLLTQVIAALMKRGVVKLNRVAQDGMKVRASAGASSFRRRQSLDRCYEEAKEQVRNLKREIEGDGSASSRRERAAASALQPSGRRTSRRRWKQWPSSRRSRPRPTARARPW
jgi:transposase